MKEKYKTKQKAELIQYLKSVKGKHLSAKDICDYFKHNAISISQSTIYRQLEELVKDGIINKYIIDSNSPACFEYIDQAHHCHKDICFHFKCEKCGKLIHLDCDELKDISKHLLKEHHIQLDTSRTVLYGLCEECRG